MPDLQSPFADFGTAVMAFCEILAHRLLDKRYSCPTLYSLLPTLYSLLSTLYSLRSKKAMVLVNIINCTNGKQAPTLPALYLRCENCNEKFLKIFNEDPHCWFIYSCHCPAGRQ